MSISVTIVYWLTYSLWQTGKFKPYLRGSVIPFLSIADVRTLINKVAPEIHSHWEHYQNIISAFNKLQTTRPHLAQQIIATEKLQQYLLSFYFDAAPGSR